MPLTCVGSGMFNEVPTSLSCKNCQGLSALPGYLFPRNLQKLPSCLGKAPLGDLFSMWLTLPMDSEEIWGKKSREGPEKKPDEYTRRDWLIVSISFSGNHGKAWLQQQSFHGCPSETAAAAAQTHLVEGRREWWREGGQSPASPRGSTHSWPLPAHWWSSSQSRASSSPAQ